MNRILVASDIHLHRWNNFGYHADTLLPKRLFDQQQVLKQIVNIARQEKVETFINGGDLFHSVGNIPVEALNIAHEFYQALDNMGVTCLFCPGNHDMIKRESPEWFHMSNAIFNQDREIELGCKVKLIGYDEQVDYAKVKGYDIVMIHQTPVNVMVNNYKFADGVNWKKLALQNKLVFFGHIHQREKLGDNCYVIGSPMHLNFGDTGTRGCYLVDTDDFKAEFIKLDYPEFLTVDSADDVKDDQNYYRVLGTSKKIDNENVVSIVQPKVFEERIKSDEFEAILAEWVKINKKPTEYLTPIKSLLTNKSNLGNKVFPGKITGIDITDFISIGNIKHTFGQGFTSISGPNGNGKTAFVDAIFWCLFGETTKGLTGNDVIRRGQEDCNVTLSLESLDVVYAISRTRKDGLDIKIKGDKKSLLDTKMKSSDKQQALENILGFNKAVFLSACYFSQENIKTLTGLTDTEKTNMITSLLGFETYDDLYVVMTTQIAESTVATEIWENKKKDIANKIDMCKNGIGLIEGEIKSLKGFIWDHKVNQDGYKESINELKAQEKNTEPFRPIDFDSKLDTLAKKEDVILETISEMDTEISGLIQEKETTLVSISETTHKLSTARDKVRDLELEIKALESTQSGEKCDKCGSMITKDNIDIFIKEKYAKIVGIRESHLFRDELTPLMEKKKDLGNKISDIEAEKIAYKDKSKAMREDRESYMERKKLQDIKIQTLDKRDAEIEAKIDSLFSLIEESKVAAKKLQDRQDELVANKEKETEKIETLEAQVFEAGSYIEKLEKDLEIFEFWKVAFSSKGVRSLLLDRFCNQFNAIVNDYLSKASNGGMSIVLNPIKVLKSGDNRNKISLDITLDDSEVSYASLSGGEKRRVDVSLCLTLNKWLSTRCGLSNGLLGLIIFDELFSFLDREGEENIGTLLYEEGHDKIILVISHTPELSSYSQRILNISKVNGVSSLME